MSNKRLRKAEEILSKLRARAAPVYPGVIIARGETYEEFKADAERQLAAYPKNLSGTIIVLPEVNPPPV